MAGWDVGGDDYAPYYPGQLTAQEESDPLALQARMEKERRDRVTREAAQAAQDAAAEKAHREMISRQYGVWGGDQPTPQTPKTTIGQAAQPSGAPGGDEDFSGASQSQVKNAAGYIRARSPHLGSPESVKSILSREQFSEADRPQEKAIQNVMLKGDSATADEINDAFGGWDKARQQIFGPSGEIEPFDPQKAQAENMLSQAGVAKAKTLRGDPFMEEKVKSRFGEAVEAARVPAEMQVANRTAYQKEMSANEADYRTRIDTIQRSNLPTEQKSAQLRVAQARKEAIERHLSLIYGYTRPATDIIGGQVGTGLPAQQ